MQVVSLAELLIQEAIVFRSQRLRQIEIRGRKILAQNQSFRQGLAVADQVIEQTADAHQAGPATAVGQGRGFLSQTAQPAQDVGIATYLGGGAEFGVGGVQITRTYSTTGRN